jgi:hypothetical protein
MSETGVYEVLPFGMDLQNRRLVGLVKKTSDTLT